jgi:hypothetical protein
LGRAYKTPQEVPSKLLLFLSVDVSGSTKFKDEKSRVVDDKSPARSEPNWIDVFSWLYTRVPYHVAHSWRNEPNPSPSNIILYPEPILWKTIGDEFVFVKEITHHIQVLHTVRSFLLAIDQVRIGLQQKAKTLDLRSCVWMAGFPVNNRIMALRKVESAGVSENEDNKPDEAAAREIVDAAKEDFRNCEFIGPWMDIGFRLAKHSSARKCIVSAEVALMLAGC